MKHPIEQLKLIRDATELLTETFQSEIKLEQITLLKDGLRAQTYRIHLGATSAKIPPTLIVKRIKSGTSETENGFNDWGCLQFLSAARRTRQLVPKFIAGNKENSLYCIEDLGASIEIEKVFMKSHDLDDVFLECAKASAELSATTSLREPEFEHVLTDLPVPSIKRRYKDADEWRNGTTKFREWLTALMCPEMDELPGEILKLVQSFEEPGALLTFSHGDFAPTNLHSNSKSKSFHFMDFEFGGYRNALYDMTAWNILCPLRDDLVVRMREIFKADFKKKYEFPIDEAEVDRAWVTMSLYRAVAMFAWIPTGVLLEDKPWVGEWSCRLALMTAARRAVGAAAELQSEFPALHFTFSEVDKKLRNAWAEMRN